MCLTFDYTREKDHKTEKLLNRKLFRIWFWILTIFKMFEYVINLDFRQIYLNRKEMKNKLRSCKTKNVFAVKILIFI